jgi:cell cycle checkpoint protein
MSAVLQFIDEDAIDDVEDVSKYLSDTDYLLGAQGSFRSRNSFIDSNDVDPHQVGTVVASSVAARGVLFGNSHPAPRRYVIWSTAVQFPIGKLKVFKSCSY